MNAMSLLSNNAISDNCFPLTLVLGGTRSGKSEFAEQLVKNYGQNILYVATAEVYEGEGSLRARVEKHQARRPASWKTVECPKNVATTLAQQDLSSIDAVMVDCITLLTANNLFIKPPHADYESFERALLNEAEGLMSFARESGIPWVLVSSEVGLGIVSGEKHTRDYVDGLGRINQYIAQVADHVYLIAAGLSLKLK